jgi:hypothetical protein
MKARSSQRGQVLPLAGIAIVVLLGAAGFAVDVGFHQYQQRMQQTAADSAAIAGAEELMSGNYVAAARHDAGINGFTDNTGALTCPTNPPVGTVCVDVYNPPQSSDAFNGNGSAVEVDITVYHPTFFEQIFSTGKVPVTTKAVALLKTEQGSGCIYALDTQHGANFNGTAGGGVMYAPSCGLELNGGANFNNAVVDAASIDCAATCSNGTFTGAQPTQTAPVSDPCPQIVSCAYLAKNPPSCSSNLSAPPADAFGNVTLPSGCYNGFTYHNSSNSPNLHVQLCGLYVVTNTADISSTGSGAPPITIDESPGCSGVTFYVSGNGAINFRNANMTLYPPSSGDYSQYTAGEQNILFYQNPSDTNTANLQSATCLLCISTISGMMYFPSSNFNYTKSTASLSGTGALIVSYDLNCNGCLASAFPAPAPGLSQQRVAVLGE